MLPFPGLADDSEQSDDVLSPDAQCSSDQDFEEPSSIGSGSPIIYSARVKRLSIRFRSAKGST